MNFVQVYQKNLFFWSPLDFRIATKGLWIWNVIIPTIQVRNLRFSSMKSPSKVPPRVTGPAFRLGLLLLSPLHGITAAWQQTFMRQEIKCSNLPYFPAAWETRHGWHSHYFLMGVMNTCSCKLVGQGACGNTSSKRWVKPNSTHVWGGAEKSERLSHSR